MRHGFRQLICSYYGSGRSNHPGNPNGFILLTVLFIVSILLGASTAFAIYARGEVKRVSEERFSVEARAAARIACRTIADWIAKDDNEYDSELELLYDPVLPIYLDLGEWRANITIEPQNKLLPINDLFLPDGVTMKQEYQYPWEQYWILANKEHSSQKVLDFIDTDGEARAGSVEEETFLNRKLSHLSELLRLSDVDTKMIFVMNSDDVFPIERYMSVYGSGALNINLVPAHVLEILDPDIRKDVAEAIIDLRSKEPIKNEKDLMKVPGFPMSSLMKLSGVIGYRSDMFRVKMTISNAKRVRNYDILLHKTSHGCQIKSWGE